MNLTAMIDVAIGLGIVYLGASLFVTIINEFWAQMFQKRSKYLATALDRLLNLGQLRHAVKDNDAFKGLLDVSGKVGSYVDPNVLAQVLVGSLRPNSGGVASMNGVVSAIRLLPESTAKNVLLTLAQSTPDDVGRFTRNVSEWIDRSLTILGDGYKRNAQIVSFIMGAVIAVLFNIDTLTVTERLYRDRELRDQAAVTAAQFVQATTPNLLETCPKLTAEQLQSSTKCQSVKGLLDAMAKQSGTFAKLPIGWDSAAHFWNEALPGANWTWLLHWIGWLLTALALSLGAPFWFDLLNRLVNVRHTIRRPEVSKP